MSPELLLAIYGTLVAPVLIFFGNRINAAWVARAARRRLVDNLAGLPYELKVPLVPYYVQGAHTLPGNPAEPAIDQLRHMGLVIIGRGRGSYDAVDAYVMLRADVLPALARLKRKDSAFAELVDEYREFLAQEERDRIAGPKP